MTSSNKPSQSDPKAGAKPRRRKQWILWLGVPALLAGVFLVLGVRYFPKWNEERLVRHARTLVAQKSYNSAVLAARRVLQLNPRNAGATAIMADLADATHSRDALYWYHRLIELQPENLDYQLTLAEHALHFGSLSTAEEVLKNLAVKGRDNARYHELAGKFAVAKRHFDDAESEFAEASRLEPANQTYAFEWAEQALPSTDTAKHDRARQLVEQQLSQPERGGHAARALINDALRNHDGNRALSLGKNLAEAPGASLDDRLVYLQLLHDLKRPQFPVKLLELQESVVKSSEETGVLITWLKANGCALLAVEWSKRLPGNLATTMPVPVAIAEAYVTLGDWPGLRSIVVDSSEENTGDPQKPATETPDPKQTWAAYEFMRLALAARTLREQGEEKASRIRWNEAIKAINGRPEALAVLARAAVDWGWENESDELLWTIARSSHEPRWALDVLFNRYYASKSLRNILAVCSRMLEVDPNDPWVQNNVAIASFLLQTNVAEALKLAGKLHEKEPSNPAYAGTYALGLHLQGRTKESIQIMRSLGPSALSNPNRLAYYCVFLVADGEFQEAKTLEGRIDISLLLPEEAEMLTRARSQLANASGS